MTARASVGLLALLALLGTMPANAGGAIADPSARVMLKQPSGVKFEARLFGDEWYNGYETTTGFTVLRDARTGRWEYARRVSSGKLSPGGDPASAPPPAGLARHLRDPERLTGPPGTSAAPADVEAPTESPSPANVGTQPSLVILAQFTNRTSLGTTAANWSQRFFGATESVADYYDEVSYGQLDIVPASESHGTANDGVVGWLSLGQTHPGDPIGQNHMITTRNAVLAANPYVNFASYDKDGNGTLSADELHVTVVAAGYEASQSCAQPAVWGHKWTAADNTPTVDGVLVGGDYTMFGEQHCSPQPHMATLGIMVHEIGHDLDLPDLYDTDGSSDDGGVGYWSVMALGSWLTAEGNQPGADPPHPDAFSKYYQGWTNPQPVSGTSQIGLVQTATSASVARLLSNPGGVDWTFGAQSGTGEYFLVENRQQTGYDVALPGCGLLIWHIDETRSSGGEANASDARRLVDLEEADDNDFAFQPSDTFTAGVFDVSSEPNSHLYSGAASGVSAGSFDAVCAPSMNVTLTAGAAPPANDSFTAATQLSGASASRAADGNVAASKEAGEPDHAQNPGGASVWYRWTAPAAGAVTIDTRGSDFDTTLGVYTGGSVGGLVEVTSNDDIDLGVDQDSEVNFEATAGATYRIAIDGYNEGGGASQGTLALALEQAGGAAPADDSFAAATQPSGASASPIADVPGRVVALRLRRSGRVARLRLRCVDGDFCAGRVDLVARDLPRRRRAPRGYRRGAQVILGRSAFQLDGGEERIVTISIGRRGRSLLRRPGRRGLWVTVTGSAVDPRRLWLG